MGAAVHLNVTGAKGGDSKPKSPVEAPDSLQSTNLAKLLIAVGEGEFDGTPTDRDIYLDNTPIMDASGNINFPGVKWEWRQGSVEQDYIQGIPAVENETTVGVELRSDNPFTRALSNTQLSAVRVRMSWPRLASQDSSGNTNGYRIEYAIDIATDGGAYVEAHLGAVDGKTTNGYQRSVRVNLPAATSGWMMRVRRITPNANSGTIADTMTIAGYTEIIDEKLRYPNTALLYIEFDAQQFQNIPSVTVDCKAKRWPVPTNYDPVARTYTGVWDGTFKQAWTNNPAFVTYGLCVEDRFGLGKRIKSWMVDKWEMYRIAQYCDQLVPNGQGGQEPRFLCDLNLQGRSEAWTLLRDLSAIYRGMVYWAHGSLFMQADMPRAQDIDYVFTRSNVIDGEFVYGGAERSTHYSRALVSYDNPANNYDTDVIPVTDLALQRRYRDRPIELSAIGCTRASEAQRRGKWALLSNSQDRTVTFKTGMEGRIPLPGYVIPVADELVAGRPNGGRISSAAGRAVTLDRDTPIKAGDRLILNLPNGSAQARTVQSVKGRAVIVTTAYSVQPEPELQWAIDYEDLAIQLFRVLKTSRTQEGQYEITALEFNPSKFAAIDTGARLEERPISVIPVTVVPPPASVTLTSSSAVSQGIAISTMTIAWPAVAGAVGYDVEWRKDNGNWIKLQRTGSTSVDVTGIYAGAYLARVRAVSAFDISSIWKSSNLTQLTGKVGLPPAVSFLNTAALVYGIGLTWGFPAGAEDTERTEIWYSKTNSRNDAIKLGDFAYPQAKHELHGLAAGVSFFFWARLIDRTGNIGPWYPVGVGVNGQSSADQSEYEEYFKDKITEGALYPALQERIDLIDGPPSLPGSVSNRLAELDEQVTDITDQLGGAVTQVRNDLTSATQKAQQDLTAATQQLQAQVDAVNAVAKSLPYNKDKTYTAGQTVFGADSKLYQASKAVPKNMAPPNLTYWADIGQAAQAVNGLAVRVSTSETKITELEGVTTSQASLLNGVQSSLTTTNQNVTAAQQAAQSASDLAGGKGKVMYQAAAPAAADRQPQNLWIDTTGNANTPKRWNGSTWATVSDKVATDAASAAANALAVAKTKADASVVSSLDSRVTDAEGVITSQGTALTGVQNSLTTTNQNVTAAQQAAQSASDLAGGKGKVMYQTAAPAVADRQPQNLWIDTTGNANTPKRWNGSTWAAVSDKVATDAAGAAANALSVAKTKADASVVSSLDSRVTDAEGVITSQGTAITGVQNGLTATNQNVTAAQQAAQSASDLAGGKGKVMYQTAAPAVADRQPQNLWIDTTGNANTPKRWNGSTWAPVSDKVATDAASAAANALAVAQTKADASTVSTLSNEVTQQGQTITAQGRAITNVGTSVGNISQENLLLNPEWKPEGFLKTENASYTLGYANRGDAGVPPGAPTERVMYREIISATATGWGAVVLIMQGGTMWTPAKAGEVINVACWMYCENAPAGSGKISLTPAPMDATTIPSWGNKRLFSYQSTQGGWQRLTAQVALPEGTERFAIYVTPDAQVKGFKMWLSDLVVTKQSMEAEVLASATQSLDARVVKTESGLTSQGSAVTGLQNGLTATNQNVTAAQQAAQSASDLAGGKGKVMYQTAAPAVADRQPQNLWIDTTGNANTPKRWNGSTWAAVSDKVATDAASAAANALAVAQTKADASTVSALSNEVTQQGKTITAQGKAITNVETSVGNIGGSGINLVPAEYAAFSAIKPEIIYGSVAEVAEDAAALGGFALKVTSTSTTTSAAIYLAPRDDYAGYNMAAQQGKFILSYHARADVDGHTMAMFVRARNGANSAFNSSNASQDALTTSWVRYSQVVDLSAAGFAGRDKMTVGIQFNRSGVAGRVVYLDRIMLEPMIGTSSAPSNFNLGDSFHQTGALASATQSLDGRVSQTESGLTSQGAAVTNLQNSLTTTNQNVTAAQQAAQSASDLAGGKGKVMYQTAAPAVADRQPQNLWIDTTGNANTPKRWNGSTWAVVSDKVATDAASAAANALAVAQTKADASTVSGLSNTVSQQGSAITAQGTEITNIKASVGNVAGENLLLDPSFANSNGLINNPTVTVVSRNDASVPVGAPSARVTKSTIPTTTGNTYYGFSSALNVRPPEHSAASQIAVTSGEVYDFELYAFSSMARQHGMWIQFYDGAGVSVGHNWAAASGDGVRITNAAGVWTKLTGQATVPADCIRMAMTFRMSLGDAAEVFLSSPVVRKRTGQESAQATATQSLDGRVSQTEKGLTSQSSELTKLSNTVAGKADNSALQTLVSTVAQQGNTLNAQGTAVTQLQSTVGAIGGSGTNLLSDAYSWLSGTSIPQIALSTAMPITSVVDATVPSGYRYRVERGATSNPWLMFCPTNNAAGWNIPLTPGKYLLSFYGNTNAGGVANGLKVRAAIWDGGSRSPTDFTFTASRTRYTAVITIGSDTTGAVTLFLPGGSAGDVFWIDSIMMERQIGDSTTPSPFVAGPSATTVAGQATAISQLNTDVTRQGTAITAQASRLDGLYVQVNPDMEGDSSGLAGEQGSLVGIWTEQSARIEDGIAQGKLVETVQSQIGETSASVQQVSETVVGVDGRVSALTTIKATTLADGRKVMAGLALGSNGETSEVLAYAQRFAVVDEVAGGVMSPFVVQNGQVFINQAFISQAFIKEIILGMTIRSQAVNSQGLPLLEINVPSGTLTLRGQTADGSIMLHNHGLYVYDLNNVERAAIGRMT